MKKKKFALEKKALIYIKREECIKLGNLTNKKLVNHTRKENDYTLF
jgi:hypothetical protein